ncbi:MAG TPA: hypothetical protein DEB21_12705, partial [Rhodospirillaceae bacterium]|nr:hypothetical protein [Rhodospirillaceae bacterium]
MSDPVSPATESNDLRDAQLEIRQLKETVAALREELENKVFDMQRVEQEARAEGIDEIKQLKDTAAALREEMEQLNFARQKD